MKGSVSLSGPGAATALLLVPLALLDRRMQRSGGPGIIPFELAGPERSPAILRRWGQQGRRAATASLLLDFPFLAAYTSLNLRLTRRAAAALKARDVALPDPLARGVLALQVTAGICDAVENAALLVAVLRNGEATMAQVARLAARTKFGCLAIGWTYGAAAGALLASGR